MPKIALITLYCIGLCTSIIFLPLYITSSQNYAKDRSAYDYQLSQATPVVSANDLTTFNNENQLDQTQSTEANDEFFSGLYLILLILGALLGAIAWIGALVNLVKAQQWNWFWLTFLFPGVGMFIYVIAGPRPLKPGQAPKAHSQQAFPSALDVLQQRYARGEIDEATFLRMRAHLQASNGPNPYP